MYIIWIIWELFVLHSVSGNLYLLDSYLNWTNSINGCGSRSIATLQNTPLNSSEWSSVALDSNGAWLGSYYIVTPVYWTNGECFQFNSSAVKDVPWEAFKNITAEKCAFFCSSKSSLVKYIALQDTHCYCLDKKPDASFPDGCKTNCTGVLNERCGSVKRKSIFAYRRQEDSQKSGISRLKKSDERHSLTNCFSLFVDDSRSLRKVYFDQESCSKKRSFICRSDTGVLFLIKLHMSFHDASTHCLELNMALAYITLNETTKLRVGANYWIGLRRFSKFVSIENTNILSESPKKCIAARKERREIVSSLMNCSTELKYVCRKQQINVAEVKSSSERAFFNSETLVICVIVVLVLLLVLTFAVICGCLFLHHMNTILKRDRTSNLEVKQTLEELKMMLSGAYMQLDFTRSNQVKSSRSEYTDLTSNSVEIEYETPT